MNSDILTSNGQSSLISVNQPVNHHIDLTPEAPSISILASQPVNDDMGLAAAQPNMISANQPVNIHIGRPLIAAADWDRGTNWTVAYSDGEVRQISRTDFLKRAYLRDRLSHLFIESAHLKPKTTLSKAQIYTAAELDYWVPGVPIRLCEGRFTWVMKDYAGFSTDKTKDAQSIVKYLLDHPKVIEACKHYFPPARLPNYTERNQLRNEITQMLNELRDIWTEPKAKPYLLPPVIHAREMFEQAEVPNCVEEHFCFDRGKRGILPVKFKVSQVMTAYCCVYDMNGQPRRHPNGVILGTEYIMNKLIELHMLRMGGILRSNFVHHGMRHVCPKQNITKSEYGRSVKHLVKFFREQALAQASDISA